MEQIQPTENSPVEPATIGVASLPPQMPQTPDAMPIHGALRPAGPPAPIQDPPKPATFVGDSLVTLVLGLLSSCGYIVIFYLITNVNFWIPTAVAGLLGLVTVVYAVKSYRQNGRMDPFSVVGLGAATYALISAINLVILELGLHTSSYY